MLPTSPDARAKMKMARGHAALFPVSSSFEVLLSWRASIASASGVAIEMGEAAARTVRREMRMNFMVTR